MARGGGGRAKGPVPTDLAPYVPASRSLPEITFKGMLLAVVLAMVLAGANAYLGLFAGLTVSATIPAAVISMAVLRFFKNRNILENTIVMTAASAGEALAAGVIFTIPALVIVGFWDSFEGRFLPIAVLAAFAGTLGVLFTIPMRRAFILEEKLQYPEGVATAEVLEVGEAGGKGAGIIALGGLAGALFKFSMTGALLWREVLGAGVRVKDTLFYAGTNLSPALLGVGYIVGFNIGTVVVLGGVISWFIGIPIWAATHAWPLDASGAPQAVTDYAATIWTTQIRYMGVGAMSVGGLYALYRLRRPITSGIRSGLGAYRSGAEGGAVPRTQRDLPGAAVLVLAAACLVPLAVLFVVATGDVPRAIGMALITVAAGFVFSSVGGYMAGVVGSSNNPISGVTIATALATGGLLSLLGIASEIGPVATILVSASIACAAAIAGDNLQDLKAGALIGSTPARQQVALIIGVVASALVLPSILLLLDRAYGIGVATAAHPDPLAAPQATLIASVAGSFFGSPIPYRMVAIGAGVAVVLIFLDRSLESAGSTFRVPVLAAAVGIYLPLELTVPIFLGGLIHLVAARLQVRAAARLPTDEASARRTHGMRDGLLLASGLIAGEALMGIFLAVPIVIAGENPLVVGGEPALIPFSGSLLLLYVVGLLIYISLRPVLRPADAGPPSAGRPPGDVS